MLIISCETPGSKENKAINGIGHDQFYIKTIDGCEYIIFHGMQKGGIIHKANCKNHK